MTLKSQCCICDGIHFPKLYYVCVCAHVMKRREACREGEREGGRKGGREEGREGGREEEETATIIMEIFLLTPHLCMDPWGNITGVTLQESALN